MLAPTDIAAVCGLSRRAVYDAIRRGELPAMRLCGRLRIRREDFEAWLAAARVAPIASSAAPMVAQPSRRPATAGSFRAVMAQRDGRPAA